MSVTVQVKVPSTALAELIELIERIERFTDEMYNVPGVDVFEVVVIATCRVCGCSDDEACLGGCWWVEENEDGYLCSSCAS